MKEHIKIFTGEIVLVNRLAFILEEEGIPFLVKNNVESASIAGFGSPTNNVILYVFKSDFDRASVLIEAYLKEE